MSQGLREVHTSGASTLHAEEGELKLLDPCNVFVKHLPSELRDADLAALFGPFGHVLSSKIMIDPSTKKSLGFGYVKMRFKARQVFVFVREDCAS